MKRKVIPVVVPIVFLRADPAALGLFDPATKVCTMNCGAHRNDPRSRAELKFLCTDCWDLTDLALS